MDEEIQQIHVLRPAKCFYKNGYKTKRLLEWTVSERCFGTINYFEFWSQFYMS